MANSFILKMWIMTKINELENKFNFITREEDAYNIQGRLDILKEFYEDFNLEDVNEKEIIIHNNF
jgi:hypothetical protein